MTTNEAIKERASYHGNCYSVQDYSAAIENMLLTITDLGYAGCWVEGYMTDFKDGVGKQIAEILKIDPKFELVCCLPVGKPAEEIKRVAKKPSSHFIDEPKKCGAFLGSSI